MIYCPITDEFILEAGFQKKKKKKNPRESCRINEQSVSFLWPALTVNEENSFEDDFGQFDRIKIFEEDAPIIDLDNKISKFF